MVIMTDIKERYYCCNLACRNRNQCARFLDSPTPLEDLKSGDQNLANYLYPFKSGRLDFPFTPDKSGVCRHFVRKEKVGLTN